MKERWGESGYLLDSLGENPLPASILISVNSIEDATAVSEYAGTLEGVEDIQYYQETVDKLTSVTNGLQIGALVVMAFLIVVCICQGQRNKDNEVRWGYQLVYKRTVHG